MTSPAAEHSRRTSFIEAVRLGVDADRNNAQKWTPLYSWFDTHLGVQGGTSGGVIGKLITESKQIGNRVDEMSKSGLRYAVISVIGDVETDAVLKVMKRKGKPASLRCILFLDPYTPTRLVVFDD